MTRSAGKKAAASAEIFCDELGKEDKKKKGNGRPRSFNKKKMLNENFVKLQSKSNEWEPPRSFTPPVRLTSYPIISFAYVCLFVCLFAYFIFNFIFKLFEI